MISGPKVPISQRRGNSSASEIKAIFDIFSITAKPEPDIGVDYQCELLSGETPTGRFFGVQAKGTKKVRAKHHVSIDKKTIAYWLQLPYPTFIILLEKATGSCYWISFTDNLGKTAVEMGNNKKSISFEINNSHFLTRTEDGNAAFISKIKKDMEIFSIVRGLPQLDDSYVRYIPVAYLSLPVKSRLEDTVRTSLNCLINHWVLENKLENAYLLCKFLTDFDKSHYDHFYMFGRLNCLMGKTDEGRKALEEAIRLCQEDKTWNLRKKPTDPPIEQIILEIQSDMQRLLAKNK